jgi:hypothetical protein
MTRRFALIVGIVYLVIGVAGFIPGLVAGQNYEDLAIHTGEGALLGLFPVNVLHHIVHLLVGALGVAASRDYDSARAYSRGLAIFYGVLAVMGVITAGNLHTMFGLVPLFSHDVWLHAVTAAIAAYVGWSAADDRVATRGRTV